MIFVELFCMNNEGGIEMKRTFFLLMTLLLALSVTAFAAAEAVDGGVVIVSYTNFMQALPDEGEAGVAVNEFLKGISDIYYPNMTDLIEVQSLNEALQMLESGRADVFFTFYDTARYIAAQDDRYDAVNFDDLSEALHLVASNQNAALIEKVNTALAELKEQDALEALWRDNIQDNLSGETLALYEMPVIDGADTYRVGVSGDCPPIDYVSADGVPMGYNIALLAALSEQMQVNFELVSMESGARMMALQSGRIDLFFWQIASTANENAPEAMTEFANSVLGSDLPLLMSDSYRGIVRGYLVPKGSS